MTSVKPLSTALIPYDPSLPHVSIPARLENVVDEVCRRSLPPHLTPQIVQEARTRRLDQILPRLTGTYSVGRSNFLIDGPQKGDHKIGVELYVPTQAKAGTLTHLEFPERDLATFLSPEQLNTLYTHSIDQIEPIEKKPVLVFSHGLEVNPAEYRLLLEELASHGYVVCNLNHPSSSGYAPFSKETLKDLGIDLRELDCSDHKSFLAQLERLVSMQEENIHFVVEQIRTGNGEFGKRLDEIVQRDQIVLAGHSLGGAASTRVAQTDPRIAACVNVDGALMGERRDRRTQGLTMPLLMIFADHLKDQHQVSQEEQEEFKLYHEDWMTLQQNSKSSSISRIEGTNHMDFCITPILNWLIGDDEMSKNALKAHQVASEAMVRFLSLSS